MKSAAIVSLRIAASPEAVFDAFTGDIGLWWQPNDLFQITPRGDGRLFFEGEAGGRLATAWRDGSVFEIGRIVAWERGVRLSFSWRQASFAPEMETLVEVMFDAIGDQTRVTVTHSGWDKVPADHVAKHGFPERVLLLRESEHWRVLLARLAALLK